MLRTFINSYKVSFAESSNVFINFLKGVPLIGKKVPDSLYRATDTKIAIGVVRQLLGIIGWVLRKALYLGLMLMLPAYLMSKGTDLYFTNFLHMFFFLNLIFGSIMNTVIFDFGNRSAYNIVTLMRADAREYYVSAIIYKYFTNFIYFIFPITFAGMIVGFSPLKALSMLILLTSCKFIGECFNIFIYKRIRKPLSKQGVFQVIFVLLTFVLAYGLPFFDLQINFEPLLLNGLTVAGVLVSGAAALFFLWNYRGYTVIAKELLTKENLLDFKAIQTDMKFADVKLDENKISKEELSSKRHEEKRGYEYLQAIFYSRHKKTLINPVKFRVAFITALFLITSALVIFVPDSRADISGYILKSSPALVFFMYFLSTGEKICKAMFYNCDSSLLRYGYYREPRTILMNFTIRLKYAVILNLIPALTLCLALGGIMVFSGSAHKLINAVPIFILILCLACFYSIHHLFIYYVIQPYTAELTVKSPMYNIINFIVYMISYMSSKVKTTSYIFTAIVIAVTTVYMTVALIMTYRVAPRTFKLR